jgi:thiamine biosynthesis lipoprotein
VIVAAALLALSSVGEPAPAGETYLTPEQALKLVFGDARVVAREFALDPADREKVRLRYGGPVPPRLTVYVGDRRGAVSGYALILTELTKTLPATFIVGIDPEGRVTQTAVLSHEDHIGTDCRRPRFLDQFQGKGNGHRIAVPNGGILHVSGATLSCQAVARAVRMAVAVVQHHFLDRPGNAAAALRDDPVRQKRYLMGSFCTITSEGGAQAVEEAFAAVARLEKVLSNYDPESELSKLHRERSLEASPDLLEFLRASLEQYRRSGGAFDPSVAPLVRLWGFKDGMPRVPEEAEIREALARVGLPRVRIDGARVTLPEGLELDPGAIGKGMAVDRAAAVLRKAGVTRAFVDFGSSAFAIGEWKVAVRDPVRPDGTLGTVVLRDESISSSGRYEKFFQVGDVVYGHILDPRSGRPASAVAGASVIAPTATESDALSTVAVVRDMLPEGRPALLAAPDGTLRMSDDFRSRLRKEKE